jgi:hypothetical protein
VVKPVADLGLRVSEPRAKVAAVRPSQSLGLRGLKATLFEAFEAGKRRGNLPSCQDLLPVVKARFPQSRFIQRPDVHYAYYKSRFLHPKP